jgi:hypothetical protein
MRPFLAVTLLSLSAVAQQVTPPPAVKPPTKPQMTSELRARYWRAQAEVLATQLQSDRATATLRQAKQALIDACGPEQQLGSMQDGEPVCEAKRPVETKPKVAP